MGCRCVGVDRCIIILLLDRWSEDFIFKYQTDSEGGYWRAKESGYLYVLLVSITNHCCVLLAVHRVWAGLRPSEAALYRGGERGGRSHRKLSAEDMSWSATKVCVFCFLFLHAFFTFLKISILRLLNYYYCHLQSQLWFAAFCMLYIYKIYINVMFHLVIRKKWQYE